MRLGLLLQLRLFVCYVSVLGQLQLPTRSVRLILNYGTEPHQILYQVLLRLRRGQSPL